MIRILHNPRCAKSRKGLEYLRSKTNNFEIVRYLDEGITEKMLNEIFLKSDLRPIDLIRKQEDYYKKYLKDKEFNQDEWIRIIIENPKLLQRPIVISKYKAVIGIPPENIDNVL